MSCADPGLPHDHRAGGGIMERASEPGTFCAAIPLAEASVGGGGRWETIDPGGVDLSLLASGRAPLLADHVRALDHTLGRVVSAWIEDETLACLVRFAPVGWGAEVAELVRAGIVTGCSMGAICSAPDTEGRIAHWRPYELSIVSLPAMWHARVLPGPPPRPFLERRAAARAAAAAGDRESWEAWPARAAPLLAERLAVPEAAAAATLREVIDAELRRHHAEAEAAARRAYGLA
jgi:phage head maturation protease